LGFLRKNPSYAERVFFKKNITASLCKTHEFVLKLQENVKKASEADNFGLYSTFASEKCWDFCLYL